MKSRIHKTGTSDTYAMHFRNHIIPGTIETIYVIFASAMRGAVRDGYLRKSPCVDIRLREKIPTVVRLLATAEVQQVIITDRRPVLAPPKTSSSVRDVHLRQHRPGRGRPDLGGVPLARP